MDPRCKLAWYDSPAVKLSGQKSISKKLVTQHWEKYYAPTQNPPTVSNPAPGPSSVSNSARDIIRQQMAGSFELTRTQHELKIYLNEPVVDIDDGDVINYWSLNETRWRNLARMARDSLAAAATGVSVERKFSIGQLLVTARRGNMKPALIRARLCLYMWYQFFESYEI